jgi:hypothetical protein
MASTIDGGNPKREILVNAMKELNMAQNSLRYEDSVNAMYARANIMSALKYIKGVIACLEAPQQIYILDQDEKI